MITVKCLGSHVRHARIGVGKAWPSDMLREVPKRSSLIYIDEEYTDYLQGP